MPDLPAKECCQRARALWLSATSEADLKQVEHLYRTALRAKAFPSKVQQKIEEDDELSERGRKRRAKERQAKGNKRQRIQREEGSPSPDRFVAMELSKKDYKDTANKLALLLCQQGRQHETVKGLKELGYKCRLSNEVLNYKIIKHICEPSCKEGTDDYCLHETSNRTKCGWNDSNIFQASVILDDFLSSSQHSHLFDIFGDINSSYWTDHNYSVEPPSPYFSYAFRMERRKKDSTNSEQLKKQKKIAAACADGGNYGFLGDLVDQIRQMPLLLQAFPQLREAKFVEMWAHNRPHASGHQMHFDSDNEGKGGVRNPIISTILYLCQDENAQSCPGGPSLVTDQRFEPREKKMKLATRGWMAYPRPRRLVAFDGTLLHGVVPGKGIAPRPYKNQRRVTIMLAFWKDLQIRQSSALSSTNDSRVLLARGAACPLPKNHRIRNAHPWLKKLLNTNSGIQTQRYGAMVKVPSYPVSCIYETICRKEIRENPDRKDCQKPSPWDCDTMGIPEYEEVFQGF